MRIRVLPEVDGEVIAAAEWYDNRRAGLGDEFLEEVQRVYEAIDAAPDSGSLLEDYAGPHSLRRTSLRRFPYAVIVQVRPDETTVIAVANTHRQPFYWLDRLS